MNVILESLTLSLLLAQAEEIEREQQFYDEQMQVVVDRQNKQLEAERARTCTHSIIQIHSHKLTS